MPWRMLLFLMALALVVVLFAANMEHRSSFSFIFGRLEQVPVFMALLVAFIAGAITMLPFTINSRRQLRMKQQKPKAAELHQTRRTDGTVPEIGVSYASSSKAGRVARKREGRQRRSARSRPQGG